MSRSGNIRTAKIYIEEIWNKKNSELIDAIFHPEYDSYSLSKDKKAGINSSTKWYTGGNEEIYTSVNQVDRTKKLLELYTEVIPDLKYEIRRVIADETQVAIFAVSSGTPVKQFGLFYPSNRKYSMDCSFYMEFKDEKIINLFFVFDSLTPFNQTGMARLKIDEMIKVNNYLSYLNDKIFDDLSQL